MMMKSMHILQGEFHDSRRIIVLEYWKIKGANTINLLEESRDRQKLSLTLVLAMILRMWHQKQKQQNEK